MTQSQSVSREPTMEEILASIRRIIEDGNPPKLLDEEMEPLEGVAAEGNAEIAAFSREFAEADVFTPPVRDAVAQTLEVRQEPVLIHLHDIDPDRVAPVLAAPEVADDLECAAAVP